MMLAAGARLGPYEVVSALGAGGMGEVYRARDTRLNRTVALKLLPTELRDRPDRRQRFDIEARAISSLQHPHICALFDVGEQDGTAFFVMEHLEGETLDESCATHALLRVVRAGQRRHGPSHRVVGRQSVRPGREWRVSGRDGQSDGERAARSSIRRGAPLLGAVRVRPAAVAAGGGAAVVRFEPDRHRQPIAQPRDGRHVDGAAERGARVSRASAGAHARHDSPCQRIACDQTALGDPRTDECGRVCGAGHAGHASRMRCISTRRGAT